MEWDHQPVLGKVGAHVEACVREMSGTLKVSIALGQKPWAGLKIGLGQYLGRTDWKAADCHICRGRLY